MSIVKYIGVDDPDLDLFESQYDVPEGMCYNSYLVEGNKIAIMDTVDSRKTEEWIEKLENALNNRKPDYLVVQHMEPDHSGSIAALLAKYPAITIVASDKAIKFMEQFYEGIQITSQIVNSLDSTNSSCPSLKTFDFSPAIFFRD